MTISIVTTCYNSASTIRETIQSILSQGDENEVEYIVVDAGSTDGTIDIVKSFGSRIKLIVEPKCSQSEGINIGLKASTGEIVAFLNSDDTYLPGTLKKVKAAFASSPSASWLAGQCEIVNSKGVKQNTWISAYKNFLLKRHSYFLHLIENYICQPAVFLRRQVLDKYGYFSAQEYLAMDYEYWLRIGNHEELIIVNEPLATFRRSKNTKSNTSYRKQFRDDLRLGVRYALKSRKYLAIPLNFLAYIKTVTIYSFLY